MTFGARGMVAVVGGLLALSLLLDFTSAILDFVSDLIFYAVIFGLFLWNTRRTENRIAAAEAEKKAMQIENDAMRDQLGIAPTPTGIGGVIASLGRRVA